MTVYTVEIADEAWAAIDAQVRYVAIERQNPDAASRWTARLSAAIDTLERMPRRYVVEPNQTRLQGVDVHRMVFERTFLVFYTVDDDDRRVTVVSFRRGARATP